MRYCPLIGRADQLESGAPLKAGAARAGVVLCLIAWVVGMSPAGAAGTRWISPPYAVPGITLVVVGVDPCPASSFGHPVKYVDAWIDRPDNQPGVTAETVVSVLPGGRWFAMLSIPPEASPGDYIVGAGCLTFLDGKTVFEYPTHELVVKALR